MSEDAKNDRQLDISKVQPNSSIDDEYEQDVHVVNKSLVETHVRLLGDHRTICQIIQLLAYIRHSIQNNNQDDIIVRCCRNVMNTPLAMDVNGQEVKDYVPKPSIDIN